MINNNEISQSLPVYEVQEVSVEEAVVVLKSNLNKDIYPLIECASSHSCLSDRLLEDYHAWIRSA